MQRGNFIFVPTNSTFGKLHDAIKGTTYERSLSPHTIYQNVTDNTATFLTKIGRTFGITPVVFTANDLTPSVSQGFFFKTANTGEARTITNFDDGYVGQMIWIIAGDIYTTIESNSNVLLNGGANFVMSLNYSVCLYLINNKWIEIARGTAASPS
jgi:hypothetical protein